MKTMKNSRDRYLKCDVLLLADVFERFRNDSWIIHGLCLNHHFSAPALSLGAMLNIAKVELGLISDADMYLFLEKDMRDGVSYISKRYRRANNRYFKPYDQKEESKHIYLDANKLYGYGINNILSVAQYFMQFRKKTCIISRNIHFLSK